MADWYLWFCCCKTIKKTDQMFSKRAGKLYKIYKQGKKKIDYDLNIINVLKKLRFFQN